MEHNLECWILEGPSRKLRKLYAQLEVLDLQRAAIEASNPVPEHAPSSLEIRRRLLKPVNDERHRLMARIDRIQNDAIEWSVLPRKTRQ